MPPRAVTAIVAASLLFIAPAHAGSRTDAENASSYQPSRARGAVVAKIVIPTVARSRPGAGAIKWKVRTETQWGRGPQQLLVLRRKLDAEGKEWLKVRLPIRPDGNWGWISADFALVRSTPYWIDVSLSRRLVSVYRTGHLVRRFRAVVGAPSTPTPKGLAAIYDPIRQPSANGFVGPWALHLTAFSRVLMRYDGGLGRVGIHGRGGASLRDPLGSARSHGCIRVDNAEVSWLAHTVPRGTPVDIHR